MATQSYHVKIPTTVIRLGEEVVDRLVHTGLAKDIDRDIIRRTLEEEYGGAKRTINSLSNIVTDDDLARFMENVRDLRSDVSVTDKVKIDTDFLRRVCRVLKFD